MNPESAPGLGELRRQVDRIDEAIVELLGQRLQVVGEIARAKRLAGDHGLALRPAREAVVMRRLLARAAGRFPGGTLLRMWRELLGAMTRAQSALTVAVFAPESGPELWDIARDHFGSLTPIQRAGSAEEALDWVREGGVGLSVLPLPGEADRWWCRLADSPVRVHARLPFAPLPVYPDDVQGLVLARLPPEPSGDDLTLLALEAEEAVSADQLQACLRPRWRLSRPGSAGEAVWHLLELDGFQADAAQKVGRALSGAGGRILRAEVLGCYARPLSTAELA